MELGITQNQISSIDENEIGSVGNKIKLKGTSLKNSINHIKNVPYSVSKGPKITESAIKLPEEAKKYNLTPKQYIQLVVGDQKPINVKPTMLAGIKKSGKIENHIIENDVEVTENIKPELPSYEQEVASEVENIKIEEPVVNTPPAIQEDSEQTFEEINNVRQQILNIKEEAIREQKEADDSEKELQELGVKYTETEKQLEAAKNRNQEMKQKLQDAINSQAKILSKEREEYKALIASSKEKKKQNQEQKAKIVPKITKMETEISNWNNETASIEEQCNAILNSLESYDNVVSFSNSEMEEKIKRIA